MSEPAANQAMTWQDEAVRLHAQGMGWMEIAHHLNATDSSRVITGEQVRSMYRRHKMRMEVMTQRSGAARITTVRAELPPDEHGLAPGSAELNRAHVLEVLRKGPVSLADLCDRFDSKVRPMRDLIVAALRTGFPVKNEGETYWCDKQAFAAETPVDHSTSERCVTIAAISDTHLCSKMQQLTHLNDFYNRASDAGVKRIYHAGDITAGNHVYPGQEHEIHKYTLDEQVQYTIDKYPERAGMETHLIGGNHDLVWLKQKGGTDPLNLVARDRPDIKYHGAFSAWVTLASQCVMYLIHPDGGKAYALSYKLQKLIESFEGGRKPHIVGCGHYHSFVTLNERNVYGMMLACFEAQTSFGIRKFLNPRLGGIILTLGFNDDGSIREYTQKFVNYLVPRERDY